MMRILIALDQSECSQLALDDVLNRYWPENSEFKLVYVIEPFDPIEPDVIIEPELWASIVDTEREILCVRADDMLQAAAARISQKYKDCEVATHLLEGYLPDQCIVDIARDWSADLVVLGSHSRHGMNRLFLGSVSHSVLLNAPCSVEIIKSRKQKSISKTLNVLICLNDSRFSEAAFHAVLQRPWAPNTNFKIVTAMPSDSEPAAGQARAHLATNAAELRNKNQESEVEVAVLYGDPRECILQAVDEWPAHLVVLGSHGRTGLKRLFLGSVSQAISLQAPCSVEVVKLPVSQALVKDKVGVASQSAPI